MRITMIMWDIDTPEEADGLPTAVTAPVMNADEAADWLSDTYGFCVRSCVIN